NEVLHTTDTQTIATDILESVCGQMSHQFFTSRSAEGGWNPEGYRQWLVAQFPVTFESSDFDNDYLNLGEIEQKASDRVSQALLNKLTHDKEAIQKAQEMLPPSTQLMEPDTIITEVL